MSDTTTVEYLPIDDAADILIDDSAPTYGNSVSGYGPRVPTRYRIVLKRGGIRRVYSAQYGNSGSPYVIVKGRELFVSHIID